MTPSKLTVPLRLGIVGTIGFNLSPIVLGYGMMMNACFLLYAGIMFYHSVEDRRVLGYATVLSACNPANSQANLSFPFLMAILTILKESPAVGRVIRELGKDRWWWLFLSAFLLIGLSVPFWPSALRDVITELKQALSRLGYLAAFPLAVGLTVRTRADGVRVVSLLCLMAVAFMVVFYFWGEAGRYVISAIPGGETIGVEQFIGFISLNYVRTQVCILLANLAVGAVALAVGIGSNYRSVPFYMASCASIFMMMQLASVGSAFAMVCGMGVLVLCYQRVRQSLNRMLLGVILFAIMGSALYLTVFRTESMLSMRIELKTEETQTIGIDRQAYWEEGIAEISKTPFGEGWSYRTGHSDWLLFLLSYGWLTGLLYIAAVGRLFLSMWRALRRHRGAADRQSSTLLLVGLAGLSVYGVNAIFDMLSSNIGYYQTVWALILTPAAVMAVTNAANRTTQSSDWRSV